MNIQIFGRSKCFDTKKAERWFKERKIKFQSIDLDRYGLSGGELNSVSAAVGFDALFDRESKLFSRLNLRFVKDPVVQKDMLLKNPALYRTPIVRNGRQATVGYEPEVWKNWE